MRWSNAGKPFGGPWYGEFKRRLGFLAPARYLLPDLRVALASSQRKEAGFRLYFTVDVPHYESRRVEVRFLRAAPMGVRVYVDGPKESRHRYRGGSLCMWEPDDPAENQWVFYDGLVALVGHIIVHLFKEAWWRETGEWLGPEVLHAPGVKQESVE